MFLSFFKCFLFISSLTQTSLKFKMTRTSLLFFAVNSKSESSVMTNSNVHGQRLKKCSKLSQHLL